MNDDLVDPALLPAEVRQAREEDPEFAEILGRARAHARNETYTPARHHPDRKRRGDGHVNPEHIQKMYELIDEWMERGKRRYPSAA